MLSGADWIVIGGGALEVVGGLTIAFDIRETSKEFPHVREATEELRNRTHRIIPRLVLIKALGVKRK